MSDEGYSRNMSHDTELHIYVLMTNLKHTKTGKTQMLDELEIIKFVFRKRTHNANLDQNRIKR